MKLVVGLGNPGARYAGTRHNVGFEVVDRIARQRGLEWERGPRQVSSDICRWRPADVLLAKPLTFMNASGPAVVGLVQFFKLEIGDVLVVVDDTNLELGRLRTRAAGSAGGHNGLKSLIQALGTDAFPRMRLGVGRGDERRDLADHVLAKFEPGELEGVDEMIDRASQAVELFVAEGIQPVMNRFNRKEDRKEDTE
jgi:PTH1 family peptidyl-tRNA hydrolase